MIEITPNILLPEAELVFTFVRSPGPGGQNVNKVATAVLLRFNVRHSTALPEDARARILTVLQHRITQDGDIIIKASNHRSQERNRKDAVNRLIALLKQAVIPPKKRKKTRPTRASRQRRLDQKKITSRIKALRRNKEE